MGTNGLIAVRRGDDMLGVYQWLDSHPWVLGNALLLDVVDQGGDLESCARRWVHDAPEWGWNTFMSGQGRGGPATDDEPSRWQRKHLRQLRDIVSFMYLLDIDARTLSVWSGVFAYMEGAPPVRTHVLADNGEASPAFMTEERPEIPVATPVRPLDDNTRGEIDRSLEQELVEGYPEGCPAVRWAQSVHHLLLGALDGLTWREMSEQELALRRHHNQMPAPTHGIVWCGYDADTWHFGQFGAHGLGWPVLEHGIGVRSMLRTDGSVAAFNASKVFGDLHDLLCIALLKGRCPGADFDIADGDVFRYRTVVETPSNASEWGIADARLADPEVMLGDSLGEMQGRAVLDLPLLLHWLYSHLGPEAQASRNQVPGSMA